MAPLVAQRARHSCAWHSQHHRCVRCDEKNSEWSPNPGLCPAHRHRPEQPTPQGVGAVAAFERDDRAATFGRVPRCLPSNRGNKTRRTVQVDCGTLHTPRSSNGGGGRNSSLVTAAHREHGHMFQDHRILAAHVPVPLLLVPRAAPGRLSFRCQGNRIIPIPRTKQGKLQ